MNHVTSARLIAYWHELAIARHNARYYIDSEFDSSKGHHLRWLRAAEEIGVAQCAVARELHTASRGRWGLPPSLTTLTV